MGNEKPGALDLASLTKIIEATLVQPEKGSSKELERVGREKRVAANSLCPPPALIQHPNPFMLQAANPQVSKLGQKISNLSGIEGIDRINQARSAAFPSPNVAGSIYDIASQPLPIPLSNAIEEAKGFLEKARDRGLANAVDATVPEEILASAEEMAQVADRSEKELIEEALNSNKSFPNLAREIMNLGIGMEKFQTGNLMGYKKQGDAYKTNIDSLIKLSSHLPKLSSEETSYELQQETKEAILKIHEELKGKGIDIFPGMTIENEFSKEQLAAANSLINHHIDASRTSLQELFTTKISTAIQFLSMIGEVMKKVSEKDDQLKRKTTQIPH
ncbi:MAG TPA: hypothetical protein VHL30_01390 [Chlamydiales bacterium]|jgi:hypothetical protein|nr:hypothetical protein [Chlamydiales bacterium]